MDFAPDHLTADYCDRLNAFMVEQIYPVESEFQDRHDRDERSWERPLPMTMLRAEARVRGLWNLFLPGADHGPGLSTLQYAPLAEISGRSPLVAPEAMNCAAPDSGNMELLAMFGTEPQQRRWLDPLLDASIRSAYCMTEPDVASSDAGNIRTRIEATSHGFVVNGTKVWSTGALSTDCQLLVVMGVSDPEGEPRRRQSIVLIPRDAPGVEIRRGLTTYGFTDAAHGGHAEVRFTNVFVPREDLLGSPGDGGRLAQARLGPGRVHHCMRLIGMAERAFELMCRRANERSSFGRRLADQGVVQERVAQARVRIDQTRLLVLRTAWLIDTIGARAARTEISAIKVATPRMAEWVIDQAIQLHGAGGMTEDLPLAMLWAQARGLRFADGPDEVHEMVLGRRELARFAN